MAKFGTKNSAFRTLFMGWNLKTVLSYLDLSPRICIVAKFGAKIKILRFGAKST